MASHGCVVVIATSRQLRALFKAFFQTSTINGWGDTLTFGRNALVKIQTVLCSLIVCKGAFTKENDNSYYLFELVSL